MVIRYHGKRLDRVFTNYDHSTYYLSYSYQPRSKYPIFLNLPLARPPTPTANANRHSSSTATLILISRAAWRKPLPSPFSFLSGPPLQHQSTNNLTLANQVY